MEAEKNIKIEEEDDMLALGPQPAKKKQRIIKKEEDATTIEEEEEKKQDGGASESPPQKNIKIEEEEEDKKADTAGTTSSGPTTASNGGVNVAKKKLSKWAARLFDPNRIKGLIEPPQTIPLNDEFLIAFGKREKDFDKSVGRTIEIETEIVDNDDDDDDDEEEEEEEDEDGKKIKKKKKKKKKQKKEKKSTEGRKVKIANLKYTTTSESLQAACQSSGHVVEEVNLIMNENGDLNVGRAYVVFETTEGATDCIQNLKSVDGRPPRVQLAEELPKSKKGSKQNTMSRYYQKDISTKCYRCGEIGHVEADCPNAPKPRVCPLCGKNDGHDMRNCPISRFCFNCGLPGHVSRECPYGRSRLPPRRVCSICFQTGHHRLTCRYKYGGIGACMAPGEQNAICMETNQRGRFVQREMTFFFGLNGVSCFNCGLRGHLGYECTRPTLEELSRDDRAAITELERAESTKLEDLENELIRATSRQRKSYDMNSNRNPRSKSAPPRRPFNGGGYDNNDSRGGGGGGRHYSSSSQRGGSSRGYSNNNRDSSYGPIGGGGGGNRRGYNTNSYDDNYNRSSSSSSSRYKNNHHNNYNNHGGGGRRNSSNRGYNNY